MARSRVRKEILIALGMLAFGLFALPPAVYWVGQRVVGEYEAEGGVWALTLSLWSDFLNLSPMALILVLGPYAVIQSLRLAVAVWRTK